MTFSISLPTVLSRIIGLNNLKKSYRDLLSFGIMTVIDFLKWDSQKPKSMHALAILMILSKQTLSWRTILRWLHDNLSGPGVEELLQLVMAILNSSLENRAHEKDNFATILSSILGSTLW